MKNRQHSVDRLSFICSIDCASDRDERIGFFVKANKGKRIDAVPVFKIADNRFFKVLRKMFDKVSG